MVVSRVNLCSLSRVACSPSKQIYQFASLPGLRCATLAAAARGDQAGDPDLLAEREQQLWPGPSGDTSRSGAGLAMLQGKDLGRKSSVCVGFLTGYKSLLIVFLFVVDFLLGNQ
jgi:hypothetical protein